MHEEKKEILGFSKTMFWQCIILFLGICGGLWINKYIYILTALFTVLRYCAKDINNIYYHLLFSFSFTVIYKLSPSSTSFFAYLMIIAGIVMIVRIRNFNALQLVFIFLFSAYLYAGKGSSYTTVLKMIMGIILFYFFVKTVEEKDFKNHIMAYSLGVLGSSIIGTFRRSLPQLAAYFKSEYSIYSGTDLAYRFTGLNYDPNFYSMTVVFAIVLCLMLLINKTGNKVLLWSLFISLIVFGFQSYSKMYLLSIIVIGIIAIIYMMKSLKTIVLAIASLLTFGTGVIAWLKKIGYMDIMYKRLFEQDISTGRLDLWKVYLNYIGNSTKTFLFGDGLGSYYLSVGGPHNTYIESVYFVGIIGTILLLLTILFIFGQKKINNRSIINYILPIAFLVMSSVLGCFKMNELFFYCMLMWLGLNINVKNKI